MVASLLQVVWWREKCILNDVTLILCVKCIIINKFTIQLRPISAGSRCSEAALCWSWGAKSEPKSAMVSVAAAWLCLCWHCHAHIPSLSHFSSNICTDNIYHLWIFLNSSFYVNTSFLVNIKISLLAVLTLSWSYTVSLTIAFLFQHLHWQYLWILFSTNLSL